MTSSLLAGLGLGFSLIVAIGAQNLFVLRQGIRREHVGAIVAVCALSDAALIAIGVSGAGLALHALPGLAALVRWAGVAFLVGYAALAARRALRPAAAGLEAESPAAPGTAPGASTLPAAVATCLALTWLNPHVYLDTVFLLGTVGASHGEQRWWFAAGAMTASIVWFTALGFGARFLGRFLARPAAWRVLDGVIAIVMLAIAAQLALGH